MVGSGLTVVISLFIAADTRASLSFCKGVMAGAAKMQLVHDEGSLLKGLEPELDRKLARISFRDFVAKLALRAKKAAADETARARIEHRLTSAAQEILRRKVIENRDALKAVAEAPSQSRASMLQSLERRMVRETLDELPIDHVVWEEVAPYLKEFYATLGDQKKALFDQIVPALEMRIRNRLQQAQIPADEVQGMVERYLKLGIPFIAESLALEVNRIVNRKDNEAVRQQTNRSVQLIVRRLGLIEVEWRQVAPELAQVEHNLRGFEEELFARVAPTLVESLRSQAWHETGNDSKDKMEAQLRLFLKDVAGAMPQLVRDDIRTKGTPRSKDAAEDQAERLHRAGLGYIAATKILGSKMAQDLLRETPVNQRVLYFASFSELVRMTKTRVTYELSAGPEMVIQQRAYLQKVLSDYSQRVRGAIESPNHDETLDQVTLRLAVETVNAVPYSPPAELALKGPLLDLARDFNPMEREVLTKHAKRVDDFVEARSQAFARSKIEQTAIRDDLYRAIGPQLKAIIDRELNHGSDLAPEEGLQLQRIINRIRLDTPLQPSEIEALPVALKLLRESMKGRQRVLFDYALPHLVARYQRSIGSSLQFAVQFGPKISDALPSARSIPDPDNASDSFRWFARVWAMEVYREQNPTGVTKEQTDEDRLVRRSLKLVSDEAADEIDSAVAELLNKASQGQELSEPAVRPGSPTKMIAPVKVSAPVKPKAVTKPQVEYKNVDDAEVAADWKLYKETNDEAAKQRLWVYYQPLLRVNAEKVARSLADHVEMEDLIQAGQFGLMQAIENYDLSRKIKFISFSGLRIRGSIWDYLRQVLPLTRRDAYQRGLKEDLIESFRSANGRAPSNDELRAMLVEANAKEDQPFDVDDLLARPLAPKAQSMNAPASADSEDTRVSLIKDNRVEVPWLDTERKDTLNVLLKGLSRREQLIMTLYYSGMTMNEVGQSVGISESLVSKTHDQVLQQLRARFEGREEELFGLIQKAKQNTSSDPTEDELQSEIPD